MAKTSQRKSRKIGNLSTIDDVARLAGVSTATVSRYLNSPTLVAEKSGSKVRKAIAELNYVPNALAGSLASSNSQAVAIFVPHLTHSITEETIENLVERFSAAGTVPFVGVTGLDRDRTQAALMAALSRRVSALVTTGPIEEPVRSLLRATNTTVIEMWGLPEDPVDIAIGFSHDDVGHALATFAHDQGYRRPHIITALGARAQRRSAGFLEAWDRLGGAEPTRDAVPIPSHYGHVPALFEKLSELSSRPDLIVTGSDMLAHGLIIQAEKQGWKVPEDIAVIGFGDLSFAAHVEPTLTTVRIDGTKIAEQVLEVIEKRHKGIEPVSNRIDCGFEIVRRQSA